MISLGVFSTMDTVRDHRRDLQRLASPRGTKPRLAARIAHARRAR